MSVSGPGDSGAAAAAAAAAAARAAEIAAEKRAEEEAQRRAQEAAQRKAAQAAAQRQAAQAAQQKAVKAAQQAQQAQQAAKATAAAQQRAQVAVTGKTNELSQHPQLAPTLGPKLDAAQKTLDAATSANKAAQATADTAAKQARALTQKANDAATQAIQAEQGANAAYKAVGKPAPFAAANQVSDAYAATKLAPTAQKQLFGSTLAVSDAATADAARLAGIKDPSTRAQMFRSLVTGATDPAYQKALVQQAGPEIQALATEISNKDSGFSTADRQGALNALSQTAEKLRPDAQTALASSFASALKDQNVGDDSNEFGTLLKNSVEAGNGTSFGVRLASALQSSGKTVAANDSSKFIGQGISDLKTNFEAAQKKVEDLKGKLGQELATWKLQGKDETTAVQTFDQRNGFAAAQADFEKQGKLLSSTLAGADLAANDPALKAGAAAKQVEGGGRFSEEVSKFSNEGDLLTAARGTLHDVPELADTKAGAAALSSAVEASGEGDETFLDHIGEYAETGESATKFVNSVRAATVQAVGVKLLSSAQAGDFEGESQKLLSGLNANRQLFGASEESMQGLTDALGKFKPGMTVDELNTASQDLGNQIRNVSTDGEGAVSQSLKGLGVIFGAVAAVKDWSDFDSASVKDKLATVTGTLNVGKEGASLITSTLTRFTANATPEAGAADAAGDAGTAADAADAAGADGAELAADAGLTAGKLLGAGLGALGSVVSGWNAVDDFSAGNTQAGVGDTLSAIGGAVATAGLVLDGTILGAEAGVVLNVAGGIIAAGGALVSLLAPPPDPFKSQEGDLKAELQSIGVNSDVADQLNSFNSDGQNTFGAWISQVAKQAGVPTGTFVRSMNSWSGQQVTDFLDAGRLQQGTDSNNGNRLKNATAVLGGNQAQALEDPTPTFDGRFGYAPPDASKVAEQKALRETPDKTTGAYTYDSGLVGQAVDWLKSQGLAS